MSNKNKQIRPSFTLEFKQSAAKLVNEKAYSQRQAADSLGVSLSGLNEALQIVLRPRKKYLICWNKMN